MHDEHEHEHEQARQLLAPLSGEPVGPPAVDIRKAIADGRRRLRTRRVAGVSVVAAVTVLVAAGLPLALDRAGQRAGPPPAVTVAPPPSPVPAGTPAPAPPPPTRCDLQLLPVPADAVQSFAFGTDPTGRFTYGRYVAPGDSPGDVRAHPVLWFEGERIEVDLPGRDASLRAVNSSGTAVGTSILGATEEELREVSWHYQDGVLTELPGGRTVRTITEQGWAVGDRVVWRSPGAQPERLDVPGAIAGIEPDGTVIGVRPGHHRRSFLWRPDGTVQDIPLPTIDGATFSFRASAVNGPAVVGEAHLPDAAGTERDDAYHVVSYHLATGEFTDLSGAAPIQPRGWNRHGWFVGGNDELGGLWIPDTGLVRLPDLGVQTEYSPSFPRSVTDDGRTIAGEVTDAGGGQHAATWRCS